MTTESTESQSELGPSVAAGQGPSQGHRRRRRRRKNKSTQSGPVLAQPPQQAAAPQAPPPPPQPRPQKKTAQPAQPQPQARKKKKTFPKNAQQSSAPGNSFAAPTQGRRRPAPSQKGPREFVGPMDHSYRVSNGNVADVSPSTIQMGNGNGGYTDNFAPVATVPVREGAVTRIYCFIEDLFFTAKIQETARKLGVKVEFIRGADKEVIARLTEMPEGERPALLVFDLNNANAKPMTTIPKFKAKLKKATSIVGFLSHLQGDLKIKAMEAGCDSVMPRSAFSQTLPNLLRRYGIEDEDDSYPQPQ